MLPAPSIKDFFSNPSLSKINVINYTLRSPTINMFRIQIPSKTLKLAYNVIQLVSGIRIIKSNNTSNIILLAFDQKGGVNFKKEHYVYVLSILCNFPLRTMRI